jgi:virulence-associated protein VagC
MSADAWDGALGASFFAEAFARKPFVARRGWPGDLRTVMTLTDLEHLLIAPPGAVASDARVEKVFGDGRVDAIRLPAEFSLAAVLERYRDGYSVVIDHVQYRWPPFSAMGASLQQALARAAPERMRSGLSCSIFLTPPRAQAQPRHDESADVYTLQIEGTHRRRSPAPVGDAPLLDVTLEPGDVLYVPRGFVHEAVGTDSHSLHVSFGVVPITWHQIIGDIAAERPEWRRSVPKAFLDSDAAGGPLGETFSAMIARLADPAAVRKHFALAAMTYLLAERQTAAGELPEPAGEPAQPHRRTFEKRYGARHHVERAGAELSVAFPGSVVRLPASCAAVLEHILHNDRVSAEELERAAGAEPAREAIARLAGAGFLRAVEQPVACT